MKNTFNESYCAIIKFSNLVYIYRYIFEKILISMDIK